MKSFLYRLKTPFRVLGKFFSALVKKVRNFFLEEPEDTPVADSIQQVFDEPDSFLEHVSALRRHLLRSLGVLLICVLVGFVYLQDLLALVSQPIGGPEKLTAVDITEPIGVGMRIVLLAAFAVALPYIIFESFLFVAPALSRRARIVALMAIPLVVVFFFGGMAFAYILIIPAGLPVLTEFLNLPTQIRPSSYVRFVTGLMFWFGILFEFPLLAYILTVMRVLSARVLVKNWRIAVVTIAVLAAVITPTIDPINMMLVMIPLALLYILSIFLSVLAGGGRGDKGEVK